MSYGLSKHCDKKIKHGGDPSGEPNKRLNKNKFWSGRSFEYTWSFTPSHLHSKDGAKKRMTAIERFMSATAPVRDATEDTPENKKENENG